jgi:hypothetical protein
LWEALSDEQQEAIRAKQGWEHVSRRGVLADWPSMWEPVGPSVTRVAVGVRGVEPTPEMVEGMCRALCDVDRSRVGYSTWESMSERERETLYRVPLRPVLRAALEAGGFRWERAPCHPLDDDTQRRLVGPWQEIPDA